MPTKVFYGRGDFINRLKLIHLNGFKKALLVCGDHFKITSHFNNLVAEVKKETELDVYNQTIKCSDFRTVNTLTNFLRKNSYQVILGIGGGTILDTVKAASVLAYQDSKIEDYVFNKTKQLGNKGLFYIAIPTTSGTGSEVTPWATIWGENKKKYSLSSQEYMFPDIAIVDPELTDELSPTITAESGIDALCQAIESYWNVNHNVISDSYALEAIGLIRNNIKTAVNENTKSSRDKMALGSLYGGLAFSNTQTTICHAVSYPMTAHWNIPHGQAVSLTLPSFVKIIIPLLPITRRKNLLNFLNVKSPEEASIMIKSLMENIGLKTTLSSLGITKEGITTIVRESFYTNRINNIPLTITHDQIKDLLVSILI